MEDAFQANIKGRVSSLRFSIIDPTSIFGRQKSVVGTAEVQLARIQKSIDTTNRNGRLENKPSISGMDPMMWIESRPSQCVHVDGRDSRVSLLLTYIIYINVIRIGAYNDFKRTI